MNKWQRRRLKEMLREQRHLLARHERERKRLNKRLKSEGHAVVVVPDRRRLADLVRSGRMTDKHKRRETRRRQIYAAEMAAYEARERYALVKKQ